LNLFDSGGLTTGTYRLINYTGSLTNNGVTIGTAPTSFNYRVDTSTGGQVNLLVTLAAPTGLTAVPGNNQVMLNWNASAAATGYSVWRSTVSGTNYTQLTTLSGTSYLDSSAQNNTSYYYVVTATNSGGTSPNSTQASAMPTYLPSPWVMADIGTTGTAGSASYTTGTFTEAGAGAGIGSTSDAFNYVYQVSGSDCSVVARVASVQNTDSSAKAGVMIRDTLSANAMEAGVWVTPGSGVIFTYRTSTGDTTSTASATGITAPYWVKITRTANSFAAYYSADGTTWTQLGSTQTIAMGTNAYIGIGVTSNVTGTLCTSTVDNVTATP